MKKIIYLAVILLSLSACSTSKIMTTEFQTISHKTVAHGNRSKPQQKLLTVVYNKHFNLEYFGEYFVKKNSLDTINYRKNMLVEIFLGHQPKTGFNIKVERIAENRDKIKVYYTVSETKNADSEKPSQPYLIVQTHKSRKPVQFFENEKRIDIKTGKIYTN